MNFLLKGLKMGRCLAAEANKIMDEVLDGIDRRIKLYLSNQGAL